MLRSDPALQFLKVRQTQLDRWRQNVWGVFWGKFDPYHPLEVKLLGRQLFNQLPNYANLAIR
jgi:hypothetical protein